MIVKYSDKFLNSVSWFGRVSGIALWPFIVLRENRRGDQVLLNHEKIHLRQQIEMLLVPFFVVYLIHYLINLIKFRSYGRAYRNICFEREAFSNEEDSGYLNSRRFWSWLRYF